MARRPRSGKAGAGGQPPALEPVTGAPGLYVLASASPGAPGGVYFLSEAGASPEASLGLNESWLDANGWYLFTEGPVPDGSAAAFAAAAQAQLRRPSLEEQAEGAGSGAATWHGVVWVTADQVRQPTALDRLTALTIEWSGPVSQTWVLLNGTAFAFPPLSVTVVQSAAVTAFQPDASGEWSMQLGLFPQGGSNYFQMSYGQVPPTYYFPTPWTLTIPLTGAAAGCLHFPIALDPHALATNMGCGFRYFFGPDASQALDYPLLVPPSPPDYCAFDVWLHPLFPLDAALSRFSLDLTDRFPAYSANSRRLVSDYFFLTSGAVAAVRPYDLGATASPTDPGGFTSGGFAFCAAGGGASPPQLYLSPSGLFTLCADSPPEPTLELMPGLFEREFLTVQPGDMLAFVTGQPATAAAFSPNASPGGLPVTEPGLTGPGATAWVQVLPGPGGGVRSYYSQPSASPYFGNTGEAFPGSVNALLAEMVAPPPIPMAPYGGVTGSAGSQPPAVYAQFESQVLAGARHAILADPLKGPTIQPPDLRSGLGAAASPPPTPRTAVTPQGMVVSLSDEGLWTAITLARQPQTSDTAVSPDLALEFGALASPGVAPPELATLLTRDQLFLVISQLCPSWPFQNRIFLGGFWFVLDVATDPQPAAPKTVLVFKYNSHRSLRALASEHSLWASVDRFNPDPAATSKLIADAIATAEKDAQAPGKPFSDFLKIADDPSWTGLLAFNARIDGSGMPLDLQMLLGGIKGELRAHHFGLQSNHVEQVDEVSAITQSSLFAVIHYDGLAAGSPGPMPASPAASPAYDYEVETLTVVFENSAISLFDVEIGMTINQLFGREVTLEGSPSVPGAPPNTLCIKGQYQDRGGVGSVTFVGAEQSTYAFPRTPETGPRVIDKVIVTEASLAPTSSQPGASPGAVEVKASFAMTGELWFAQAPFPNTDSLDLFSYGYDAGPGSGGLGFTGLAIGMSFTLGPDGSMEPGSRVLELQPELMQPAPSANAIRPNSLLYSLPLQFSAFRYSQTGLTAANTGATPIHVLELESGYKPPGSAHPGSPATPSTLGQPGPYSTTSPLFALEYDVSLGSLGSLSSVHGGISAKLLLGWGPSPTAPDADAAAVMIQLPQLSAGYSGFNLQGLLKTTFGDANLLKVDLDAGGVVYAIMLNNIQLSVFGYTFPPGVMVNFLLFSGTAVGSPTAPYAGNFAWYLSAAEAA